MAFEYHQTRLLQAPKDAFAASGHLNDASCDAGINNGGLRGTVKRPYRALKASPILRIISSSNKPSSGLMNGRIDATPLTSVAPRNYS